MILNEHTQEIQTNATNETKEFTIKTTAKAFKILSSGLYSDRIKAIIRELSCNAWDAHREAHNTKPFTVHLPNRFEPWFSVRDYGVGLSEEDVMNLYSTYFESTKTNTNSQIGALGLGSKSPFSYTDSFNVISIFNGLSKVYTAFIDENGTPSIVKVYEQESDEHNGLEIKFSVDENDFNSFAEKAGVVFRIFKTSPEVTGNENFERYRQTLNTIIEGNGWKYCTTNFYTSEKARAIQGNIEYPIDKNQLGDLTEEQEVIADGLFYIDFKIGDLDISASRESLGYDETTVVNIKNALTRVYNSFVRKVNKEIQKAESLWSAMLVVTKVMKNVNLPYYSYEKIKLSWGGKEFNVKHVFTYYFSKINRKNEDGSLDFEIIDPDLHIMVFRQERNHQRNRVSKILDARGLPARNVKFETHVSESVHFLVHDDKEESAHKAKRRARQYAINNPGKNIVFLSDYSQKFFDAMGNPPYVNVSSVELEAKPSRARSYPRNYSAFNNNRIYKDFSYNDIKNHTSVKRNFYLVSIRDNVLDIDGKTVSGVNAIKVFNILKENKIINKNSQLFLVKNAETKTKRFKNLGWRPFYPWAIDKFKEFFYKNYDFFKDSLLKKQFEKFINSMGWRFRETLADENIEDFLPNSSFRKFIENYRKQKAVNEDHSEIIQLAEDFGLKISEKESNFNELYPMIKFVSSWDVSQNWSDIKAYIQLVDSLQGDNV